MKLSFEVRPGWSAEFTLEETRKLIQNAMQALRTRPKVKCPTCRCHNPEGDECLCCKHGLLEDDEHVEQPLDPGQPQS